MATASITDIQNALKATIQDAASEFELPLSVSIKDSSADRPPSPDAPMEVELSYSGVTEIARTSTKVLEQVLLNVNLTYRYPDSQQPTLDACHLTAQQLRDLLSGFSTDAARVEQMLTPAPFETQQALQGTFQHTLTLDMDVIRDISTVSPPEITDTGDAASILTQARNAVWDSIDNWEPFAASGDVPAAWTRKFKTDADLEELSLHEPGLADVPAIAVTWGPTSANWWTQTMQQFTQQLFITCWFPANWQSVAEWRLIQLMQAFYKSAPESSPNVSYIRRATTRPPTKNSPVSLELVPLGRTQQLHAWRGQIALNLTTSFDPNA